MKKMYLIVILLVAFSSNGCSLQSAPIIGGLFPSETPTSTPTFTPTMTFTPTSTETPTLTPSPIPTDTPTITPTPGPFSFQDDFSQPEGLSHYTCNQCKIEDGRLLFGPFPPQDNLGEQFSMVMCMECGQHTYYRVSVDVTYVSGPTDRFYGIVGLVNSDSGRLNRAVYLGIST